MLTQSLLDADCVPIVLRLCDACVTIGLWTNDEWISTVCVSLRVFATLSRRTAVVMTFLHPSPSLRKTARRSLGRISDFSAALLVIVIAYA